MTDNNKKENNVNKQNQEKKKISEKITGLDIDKIEYQEIVLSHSNHPDQGYFK